MREIKSVLILFNGSSLVLTLLYKYNVTHVNNIIVIYNYS